MAQHLDRVSLSIGLNGDYFDFDGRYLLGPQPFRRPELRYYIHECIHLWQLLGSGYLCNLARDRWKALERWEATGDLPKPNTGFTAIDPEVGFSAYQLSEALCRFWDVHISGPPDLLDEPYHGDAIHVGDAPPDWLTEGLSNEVIERLRAQRSYTSTQYDDWMIQEDDYAAPYRLMLQAAGSRRAAALFPIVGYFALQTPKPPRVFAATLDLLASYELPQGQQYISDIWRSVFRDVANACGKASFMQTVTQLTPGANVIKAMANEGHVIFRHYLSLLAMANRMWPTDIRLALPGDPELRQQLSVFFLPPVVTFHDGRWAPDSVAVKMGLVGDVHGLLPQPRLADESEALQARLKRMGQAALRQR